MDELRKDGGYKRVTQLEHLFALCHIQRNRRSSTDIKDEETGETVLSAEEAAARIHAARVSAGKSHGVHSAKARGKVQNKLEKIRIKVG